jgi:hypothetical protein
LARIVKSTSWTNPSKGGRYPGADEFRTTLHGNKAV